MLSKAKQEHRPSGLYSKGTGKNACRYLRLGNRRGRAENQPVLLGGVSLWMMARSGLVLNGAEGKGAQAYRPVL